MQKLGLSGHIKHFDVFIAGDTVTVLTKRGIEAQKKVEGLGEFVRGARELRLGWGCTEDFNIIYIYDKADENFGYAVNIEAPDLSEWGYAPF